MECVLSELCYKRALNKGIMTMRWSFSNNSFVKYMVRKIGSHNMTVFSQNCDSILSQGVLERVCTVFIFSCK